MTDKPSNRNEITAYIHCALCIDEWKATQPGVSPAAFARLNVGWTQAGLQIWCDRHEANVLHIDFEGHKHPATTSRHKDH